jgi:nucleotide-binding universal stress UspA family protein
VFKHILIATDGSERAAKGVEAGVGLAKACGAKVTMAIVSEPFPYYDLGSKFGLFRDERAIESYAADCRRLAETVLAQAEEVAAAAGVHCETIHVPDRAPAAAIMETAKGRGADLIVLTSQGRTGLERLMLGSQAERVVNRAEVSVLVVR